MANLHAATSSCPQTSTSAFVLSSGYDVFINHRGPDTKNTFASYLYRGLLRCGLRVFLDKQEMEKGDEIQSQIVQAIRDASVHIAIFSPRAYAEALRGLEQKTKKNPETSEVKPCYGSDTIQNWRDALSCVADLSGFTLLGDQDDEGEARKLCSLFGGLLK